MAAVYGAIRRTAVTLGVPHGGGRRRGTGRNRVHDLLREPDLSLHRRGDLRQRPQHVEIQVITRDEPLRHIGLSLNVALGKLQTGRPHEKQIADVRAMDLPPTAIEAALTALEAARQEVLDEAAGKVGDKLIAARALVAKIPAMVEDYRNTVEAGLRVLADPKNVSAAREMVRKLLVDGKIVLTPNEARTAIAGRVHFKSLGDHVLELAGLRRKVGTRPPKKAGEPTRHGTVVAGGRFELYSAYPIRVPAVSASVVRTT